MIIHIIKSILLALGLGVDSFSVSLTNGISYKSSNKRLLLNQSLIFGLCQGIMPYTGYILLNYFSNKLTIITTISPYISLILLSYLGIKLLLEFFRNESIINNDKQLSYKTILIQGIATSIDAVSCSFSMISLSLLEATIEILIIGIITVLLSYTALKIGKEIGFKIDKYSKLFGGLLLIFIGLFIFIRR